jgi:predicted nuclease of predicted toxin-antitoxin system
MKFLLDVNVAPRLGELLGTLGHSYRHIALIGKGDSFDASILDIARESGEVVLTHDLDFGGLLAFSGDASPSVITLRLHRITADSMFTIIAENWSAIEQPLLNGAIIFVEQDHIRIRRLPILRRDRRIS